MLEKTLESPLDCKEIRSVKEINPEYSLEGLTLKLKLQYFGHLMQSQLIGKDPHAGKDWREKDKDEIVRITDLMDTNLCKLREIVEDTGA